MSEITRERVERALANVREVIAGTFGGRGPMSETFGPGWNAMVPDYVVEAFQAHGWKHMEAALERWLSTFPAPQEPADDSPERLRQRREALGWTRDHAASLVNRTGGWVHAWEDPEWAEREFSDQPAKQRYLAALTAEEQRRAGILHDNAAQLAEDRESEAAERMADLAKPVRKVARWDAERRLYILTPNHSVRDAAGEWQHIGGISERGDCIAWGYEIEGEPPRPEPRRGPVPTPEVVDVPQPIVKRCKGVEVWWNVGDEMAIVEQDDDQLRVPIALMEAMVDAIRARRAPQPTLSPEMREVARVTLWWLRHGTRKDESNDIDLEEVAPRSVELPGHQAWLEAPWTDEEDARWATQLEQLLGETP